MLPRKIREKLQDNTEIEWAGYRAVYEVFEEWADSLWWLINLLIAAFYVNWFWGTNYQFWLGIIFLSVVCLIPALWETKRWATEVYVVVRDYQNGGGIIYKFTGIVNLKKQEIPITPKGPAVNADEYENSLLYWLWVKLTHKRMAKIALKSETGAYFVNNRMPIEFDDAITRVKGAVPDSKQKEVQHVWEDVRELIRVVQRNFYPEKEGRELVQDLVNRHFYD